MNERGLVVEIMWLNSARFGALAATRPTLNELQLIQHLLDTAATVGEGGDTGAEGVGRGERSHWHRRPSSAE